MTLKMAVCIVNNNKQTKYEMNEGKPTSKWPVFTNLIRVATKVHLTLCTVAVIFYIFFSVPNYWQFCDFLVRTTVRVLFQNGV